MVHRWHAPSYFQVRWSRGIMSRAASAAPAHRHPPRSLISFHLISNLHARIKEMRSRMHLASILDSSRWYLVTPVRIAANDQSIDACENHDTTISILSRAINAPGHFHKDDCYVARTSGRLREQHRDICMCRAIASTQFTAGCHVRVSASYL